MTTDLNRESQFRPDIQALRALAVGLVVAYHANIPGIHGGFLGVDVFFVISGFVITGVLLAERDRSQGTSLLDFYARRIRRILPAATVVTIGTIFATYHWLGFITGRSVAEDAKWVTIFFGNFHFAAIGTAYLTASQPPSTLQQFWSLAVEEQFYLLWPLLFSLVVLVARRYSREVLLGTLALIAISSFAWSVIETNGNSVWAFFSPLTRAWELAIGAGLAVAVPYLKGKNSQLGLALSSVGLAGIALATWLVSATTKWPGSMVALPVLSTGLVIAGGTLRHGAQRPSWSSWAPLQWVGNISYSLYLVHWPVLTIATQYSLTPLPLHSELLLVLVSLALAAALHYAVENPFRRARFLLTQRWVTLAVGVAMIALSYGVIIWHQHNQGL
jgi:peptidoglycan/LPS O-acetylase OafA/YrhL